MTPAPSRSFQTRSAPQHLERVDPRVVPVAPRRRQTVTADRKNLFEGGLLLGEARVIVHLALIRALPVTVRAHAGAAQRLPRVLAHVAVVPGHTEDARRGDDLPIGCAVEDITHTSDDTDVATMEDFQK